MELVFASNNKHKLEEIRHILGKSFRILSLSDIGCKDELPETNPTIEGNASQKAHYIYNKYKLPCFADDTGLEIKALSGRPGVLSARYAGENCNPEDNIRKVLHEMRGIKDRFAEFRCVISLIEGGKEKQFAGTMTGIILSVKKGKHGFGYDPVFAPVIKKKRMDGRSFAEMDSEEKNKISHRAVAVRKMRDFILNEFR